MREAADAPGDDPASLHVVVTGRVQGVGYRRFVEREAARLGLSGWVRNLTDGSVEVRASGGAADVDALRRALETGPRNALVSKVRDVSSADGPTVDAAPFRVLPTGPVE